MIAEKWKPIKGFEGLYDVSSQGRIRSLQRTKKNKWGGIIEVKERILANGLTPQGYINVLLYNSGTRTTFRAHRLVAEAFIPNTDNKPHVNHIDGNKVNNCVDNLEWCTIQENNIHAYSSGLKKGPVGAKNGGAKLTESQVKEIRILRKDKTLSELASLFNVSFQLISNICLGKNWKSI